jgi:RNA polymerase sigma-70 factor, ECF subfamily
VLRRSDITTDRLQRGFRYALSLCCNETEAEDLVQDAWLRLYPAHQSKIDIGLLITAIRNLYIDRYRRSRLIVVEPYDENLPDSGWDRNILPHEMDEALAQIRPEEREAIYLNVVEGYTAQEIAQITDTTRNSVLSLIHRGKKKLAVLLRDSEQEDQA